MRPFSAFWPSVAAFEACPIKAFAVTPKHDNETRVKTDRDRHNLIQLNLIGI